MLNKDDVKINISYHQQMLFTQLVLRGELMVSITCSSLFSLFVTSDFTRVSRTKKLDFVISNGLKIWCKFIYTHRNVTSLSKASFLEPSSSLSRHSRIRNHYSKIDKV